MTTKAISFLGYTKPGMPYRPTTYVYGDQECHTAFMAEATAHFFQHEITELLVLVTEQASTQNFADLEQAVGSLVPLRQIPIPSGQNEQELWAMFAAIESQIAPGDQIIFDITNSFRSLPVLALLATSFVRVVRGATVERMLYGAFDAKDEATNRTPVFDLTPFVRLLDWTTATDAFLRYGRADALVPLVRNSVSFTNLATTLDTLTLALQTSRPSEVMVTSGQLRDQLTNVPTTLNTAHPFHLLLDTIAQEYGQLEHRTPSRQDDAREVIQGQLAIIEWYAKKRLFVQAITLAREWLVSVVIAQVGGDLFDSRTRELAESAINERDQLRNGTKVPHDMLRITSNTKLKKAWSDTRDLRNDLGHTGMRKKPAPAADVAQRVIAICASLPNILPLERSSS